MLDEKNTEDSPSSPRLRRVFATLRGLGCARDIRCDSKVLVGKGVRRSRSKIVIVFWYYLKCGAGIADIRIIDSETRKIVEWIIWNCVKIDENILSILPVLPMLSLKNGK
jgi:hypothetical protein